jgi:amino acid transporter
MAATGEAGGVWCQTFAVKIKLLLLSVGCPTFLDHKLILLIWVTGALCALAGAFCYSELGVNFPSSGGEYVYLTRAFGPTWGFMTGWVSLVAGFSAPIAASALAFADYLGYFFPVMKQNARIQLTPDLFE